MKRIHHPPPLPALDEESGMALLIVLAVVAVLTAAALKLTASGHHQIDVDAMTQNRFIHMEMARSGIHLGMALLERDANGTELDSIQEEWADPQQLTPMVERLGFERGKLTLTIEDEMGKLQVNALIQKFPGREINAGLFPVWERFLTRRAKISQRDKLNGMEETAALLDPLIDWLDDRDDNASTGLSGAESGYYLGLARPHVCANGPMVHVSELFLIKGMSPDLFAVDDRSPSPEEWITTAGAGWLTGKADSDIGIVFSGKVNVNTAPVEILRALLPTRLSDFAADLSAHRSERVGKKRFAHALDRGWVENLVEMSPTEKQAFDAVTCYTSSDFTLVAHAGTGPSRVGIRARVHRLKDTESNRWFCRLLWMEYL